MCECINEQILKLYLPWMSASLIPANRHALVTSYLLSLRLGWEDCIIRVSRDATGGERLVPSDCQLIVVNYRTWGLCLPAFDPLTIQRMQATDSEKLAVTTHTCPFMQWNAGNTSSRNNLCVCTSVQHTSEKSRESEKTFWNTTKD